MPANVELRLAETSPGPAELAKLAQEVRALSGITPGRTMLALTNTRDGAPRPAADGLQFDEVREKAVRAEERMYLAMRDRGEVQFRSAQELALLRDTVNRVRVHSDINQDLDKREESMKLLMPILQDLDRRATLLQYNDSLIDDFLTTVQNYGEFWASKPDLQAYLQAQKPPTLWQNVERQEKVVAAILGELKVLMPQIARLSEARLLQHMLHEDGIAAELGKVPAEKRGQQVAALLKDYPGLSAVPVPQHGETVTQLIGRYRTAEVQINNPQNPRLAAEIAGTGTLRKALEDRLAKVEGDLRAGAREVSGKLPDAPRWAGDAWTQLQKLVLPEITDGRRTESMTLNQLKDKYDNAVLRELIKVLPGELHDVKLDTIRDDVEANHILREGIPEAGANAATVAMLPAKTTIDGREVDTQECTPRALINAYPNNQILRHFCQLITPDVLAKRLRNLSAGDMLQLRSARTAAYADNAEKRSRDMFRIGEPWRDVRGKQGTYETKVASNLLVDVMLAESDRLCDEIFTSGKAGDLPKLVSSYKAVMTEQMKAQEEALSFNAQMMQLLAVQRHFGPMTRLANFNEIRLNPRQIADLQRNLPPALADEMDKEWERYGVGLKEYLAAIKTVADRYSNAIDAMHEKMVRAADHIAQQISKLLQGVHTVAWALPDITQIGGPTRRMLRAAGATWVIDTDGLKALLEEWKGEFVTLKELLTTFKNDSAAARAVVLKDVTQLERLVSAVPPKEMAASEYDPVIPDVTRMVAIEPRPAWLPENVRKAYLDARAALTALPNTPEKARERRIASDKLRAAEQAVLDKYLDDLLARHRVAKQALAKAQTDNAGAVVIKERRDELDKILAEVSGVYLKIFEQLNGPDISGMHAHVRDLVTELNKKIDFHGQRFHEYDQMQNSWWSSLTGLAVTYLEYNLVVRPVLNGFLRAAYNRSWRYIAPTYRGPAWSFSGFRSVHNLWNRVLPNGLNMAWNNTVGRAIPALSTTPGRIPSSGAIEWAKLTPEMRANYVHQLGKEAQALNREAARVRALPSTDPARVKALGALEARAKALQERMAGMDITEYRQVARQSMSRRVPPITDAHVEVMHSAHMTGGNIPADARWSGATLAEKRNILMGLDPTDATKGLRLADGTVLVPGNPRGTPATFPPGHPKAGQQASFAASEADDILRSGMAGQRVPARAGGPHIPNPRAIEMIPQNAAKLRQMLANPRSLLNMSAAEFKAMTAELKALTPRQATVVAEELQAAARADAQIAKAMEGSRFARGVDRAGRSAASELSALKSGGMVVFEVAMLAFQIYMLYENIKAYNKALEQSKESIKNMREQVEKAGFVDRGGGEYHNAKLDVTINLYDLERGLGAEANARWRDAVMTGVALGASTAITVLSMTSVIGGPVTIVLMIGVVIVEMVVNKISEKIKEAEQKEFLSNCPAWLLMALGTMQSVHDTPDGFLRKLELGGGVDEAAAKKLVFIMWVKNVRENAPEIFNELSLELVTWNDQEKFYNEKFVKYIYPEWKRCLFMRIHGRPKGNSMDDERLMNEMVKNYYLSEYIPIADLIKTQEGASNAKIRQALIDATVGSLNAARVQRYWKMHRTLQTDGDVLVDNTNPPEFLSSLMEPMGRHKTWSTRRRTADQPGFVLDKTVKEHVERWTNREHGKWLLVQRFGGTAAGDTGASVDVGGAVVNFTWNATNHAWTAALSSDAPVAITAVPAGITGTARAKYLAIADALQGKPGAHDDWTRFQHGRWLLLSRYQGKESDKKIDVQFGAGEANKYTFELDGTVWKWRKGATALAAMTVAPTGMTSAGLAKFNEIAQLIAITPDITAHATSMRAFGLHADTSNMSPDSLNEPALFANAPEELYEAVDDPIVRLRALNARRGERGSVTTSPWAPGWAKESDDQAFAVQTLVRGMWGIPRAVFGHDALGSAIRYERAGGLFANDGERPHMRRITSATLELFRRTDSPVPVGYDLAAQRHIFSDIADVNDQPAVFTGIRRPVPPVPTDTEVRDCFKAAVDHTLTLDCIPSNGPDNLYGGARKAFRRENLRSVVIESQLFNEGQRRNSGFNKPEGEEKVFVANVLLTFSDGQRQYHLRRGVVFRKDGESWRPVWGEAVADTSSSLGPDAGKYVREPAESNGRVLLTRRAANRADESARERGNRGLFFRCRPDLGNVLFPGRTNRPLVYISPEGAAVEAGTPGFDLVKRLVQRQTQDSAGQIDNPAAYYIELTDRAHGAGTTRAQGRKILMDDLKTNEAAKISTEEHNGRYDVTIGEGDDAKTLSFFCRGGLWVYQNNNADWVPVSVDVRAQDVGDSAAAAGQFNRLVLLALRGISSKPVIEALSTAVPRGPLGDTTAISRQAAVATCTDQEPNGAWKSWNVEVGANISHVDDGSVSRTLWLGDAISIRHNDYDALRSTIEADSREDVRAITEGDAEVAAVLHGLPDASSLPEQGFVNLQADPGRMRKQVLRTADRTVVFQERLPDANAKTTRAYIRFETGAGVRLWPTSLHFKGLPDAAELQKNQAALDTERTRAAQSWNVDVGRVSVTFFLSPEAEGQDTFLVDHHGDEGVPEQFGVSSAGQIMQLHSLHQRRQILGLLSTPVLKQKADGEWETDADATLRRMMRYFTSEVAEGANCRDQLVTALSPMLMRAPDQQFFLRQLFHTLLGEGSLRRDNLVRITRAPDLVRASDSLVLAENSGERVIRLPGGVELKTRFVQGGRTLGLRASNGGDTTYDVKLERVPRATPDRATEIVSALALAEGGSGFSVADLKNIGDDRVCITVTSEDAPFGAPLINRLPISLVGSVAWDTEASLRGADNRVVSTGPRESVMVEGAGADRRTFVLRKSFGSAGGREYKSNTLQALRFGSVLEMHEFKGDNLERPEVYYAFDNIGRTHAYPPSPEIAKNLAIVSNSIKAGDRDGDKTLAEMWADMPAALRDYDKKIPLQMPPADVQSATKILYAMQVRISVVSQDRRLSPLERDFEFLLTELDDELMHMRNLPRMRTFLTTPRAVTEPGSPGFNRSAFEAPISDILGLYYHSASREETNPSLNRGRFTAHMAALYRTLNAEQRRALLERMFDSLNEASIARIAANPSLTAQEKYMFVIDSVALEKVRATEYLRLKHGATVSGEVLTVAGGGKNLEFSFRSDMMYWRKPGTFTWKDITIPVSAEDVDGSAAAVAHFNGTVMPDLLAGLDMLSRDTLNRLHVANELRRNPNVRETNGTFVITFGGKTLTVIQGMYGWQYASRQPLDPINMSMIERRTRGYLDALNNPPVSKTAGDNPVYTVTQQNVRSGAKRLDFRFAGAKGWEFKAAGDQWKTVQDRVLAADVGGSAAAATDFNTNILPKLMNWVGMYWPVKGVDIGGSDDEAKAFTSLLQPLSRDYGNVNTGVLNRLRGLQVMKEFTRPAVTENAGVFTVSHQGVDNPKTLQMRFEKDGWEFKAAGNIWRHVYNLVLPADVGGSEEAAAYFNASVLPKFTHAMLRRTATLASYEALAGDMADEREMNRVRGRSNSPYFQLATLNAPRPPRAEGDDLEDMPDETERPRERQFVRYVPEIGKYVIVPEVAPGQDAEGFRFGVRSDGDSETEWITVTSLRDLTDTRIPSERRALMRAALSTPHAHFSQEAIPPLAASYAGVIRRGILAHVEAKRRLDVLVRDEAKLTGTIPARAQWEQDKAREQSAMTEATRSADQALLALNRDLNLLPASNRGAREQFADGVDGILRQSPASEKLARLNAAGTAIELVPRITPFPYEPNDTFRPKVAALRTAIEGGTGAEKALADLNAHMNAIENVSLDRRTAYANAVETALTVPTPVRMAIRVNAAGTALELVPRPPDAADAAHRRSLEGILNLCQSEGGADVRGAMTDFKVSLLQYLQPMYERAIRKDVFLDKLLGELQKSDFRIDAACVTGIRRTFDLDDRLETFVPLIDPTVQQDTDLGGCILRTRPDGAGKVKFEVITPANAPAAYLSFDEDKFDYNWSRLEIENNVVSKPAWGRLLTLNITAGNRTVVRNMPVRINDAEANRARELAREALLRRRLEHDVSQLRTAADADQPNMGLVEHLTGNINVYLARVKNTDSRLLSTKELLTATLGNSFFGGRMLVKGNRGVILAEVAGAGETAVPSLRFVRADVLRSQIGGDWVRLRNFSGTVPEARVMLREFNDRLKVAKDLEMPFLDDTHGIDVRLPGQPGYRLFMNKYSQEVTMTYAPFEAMPNIERTAVMPEVVLAAGKKTTVSRTEPGKDGETVSVDITVNEGRPAYAFSANAEGADDAAKLRDVGVTVEVLPVRQGDPAGSLRVRLSIANNAEHPGTYGINVNEGRQVFTPVSDEQMRFLRTETGQTERRGRWLKRDGDEHSYICVAVRTDRLALYRANGEARERLNENGTLWEAVPADEARALPALPKS